MSRMASRADLLQTPLPVRRLASVAREARDTAAFLHADAVTLADASGIAPLSASPGGNGAAVVSTGIEPARPSTTQPAALAKNETANAPASAAIAMPATSQTRATTSPFAAQAGTAHTGAATSLPHSPANAGSIGGALLSLLLVIGLILALAWLARRMPGFRGTAGNASLRVVGSLSLGPRERVVVVAVGDTQLVLGVGAGGTRTLHTLAEPLPVAAATTSPAFAQLLAQHFGKKA